MADWTPEQCDWMCAVRDAMVALERELLRDYIAFSYAGVAATRKTVKHRRCFEKSCSLGLAAFHAGKIKVLAEEALRGLEPTCPGSNQALERLRAVIASLPPAKAA